MTWQPIETAERAPYRERFLGVVDGEVRLIMWTKTSHVPIYGWCLVDQGAEDCDLCTPTHWQPLPAPPEPAPDADAAFLTAILARAQAGGKATHEEIARLKRLADWADAPPAPGWDGTMDVREVEHAVEDARGRMGK
jgi:hypothetical protein